MKDTRPIVLLDLDNTILDFDIAERTALSRALTRLGVPFDDETLRRYNQINLRHWEMLEDGIITREQVLYMRFEALYREIGVDCDPHLTQQYYETLLAEGHWFLPGAEEMLEALYGPYRLALCSNGTQTVQDGRIESAGIAHYFEKIFVSEHMGANKPEKRYFELCFAALPDFDPKRCIIVGDSLTSDIRGGKNAGILTCWFNPRHKAVRVGMEPDYEIDALDRLAPLLRMCFT
ncbi:MAG: YjjG family noncanonical pyrimidine nucleotidase [Oscillospiraceae bacterium]|nr:YjjG family noncanonical pyrimidine nucleotidase [Oscillospiraceae bacterium]